MDHDRLRALLLRQEGVVSRRQLVALGAGKPHLDRLVRRRELVRVHAGVYVEHTGPLTAPQRAWAAVLYAWPAALYLQSAVDPPGPDALVHVAIDARRRVREPSGVRIHRVVGLDYLVAWNLSPPRVRVEPNVLELLHRATNKTDVVRLVTDAVHGRRTTAHRLRSALLDRPRIRRRSWVLQLLDDVEAGACSVLEHGYLARVERPHGLPRPSRQRVRIGTAGREYRDVEYDDYGLVIELDGRLGHDAWVASGRDADRDLDDHAAGRECVRLRWAQVFDHPCRTADRLAAVLRRRGWTGDVRRCGPDCIVLSRSE